LRLLMHVAVRRGAELGFPDYLWREVARMRRVAPESVSEVNLLERLEADVFGPTTPYSWTIEMRAEGNDAERALCHLVEGIGERMDDGAHSDLCTALVGEDRIFVPCDRTPVRYQYLMRRQASLSHESYLRRYAAIHSGFGLKTPGIRGYVQFHVDSEASRRAARAAGVGIWGVDSVSELHLDSVEHFLAQVTTSPVGVEAIADEEKFVDRARSLDFCSRVHWQERGKGAS
jgi:hypothetical protein